MVSSSPFLGNFHESWVPPSIFKKKFNGITAIFFYIACWALISFIPGLDLYVGLDAFLLGCVSIGSSL